MANRRQLVKRRATVRNIRKITRTMQLIATARFQKALTRAQATRPYARTLAEMVESVSRSLDSHDDPLLDTVEHDHGAMIVITSNRGLCGGYNGHVLRTAISVLGERRQAGETVDVHAVGKKGVAYLSFVGQALASRTVDIDDRPRFKQVAPIANAMMEAYKDKKLATVDVCYMRFISSGSQRPEVMRLLPISVEGTGQDDSNPPDAGLGTAYDFYPAPDKILKELLPATVRMRLFQCFTDAAVSEQIARMVAMKAATDSAGDMIKMLTRQYNRARQTSITMELLDIIGGVAALGE